MRFSFAENKLLKRQNSRQTDKTYRLLKGKIVTKNNKSFVRLSVIAQNNSKKLTFFTMSKGPKAFLKYYFFSFGSLEDCLNSNIFSFWNFLLRKRSWKRQISLLLTFPESLSRLSHRSFYSPGAWNNEKNDSDLTDVLLQLDTNKSFILVSILIYTKNIKF